MDHNITKLTLKSSKFNQISIYNQLHFMSIFILIFFVVYNFIYCTSENNVADTVSCGHSVSVSVNVADTAL